MKIAINCIYYTPKGGGITEYIYNLVKEIININKENQIIFYISKDVEFFKDTKFDDLFKIKTFPFHESQKIKRSLFQQIYWNKEERIENFDIFHSPFFYAPKFEKAKLILTVHDLRFLNYPSSYKKLRLFYLKRVVEKSIKRANHLIAISNFTKNEIIKHYNISENKIKVILEAIDRLGFLLTNKSKTLSISGKKISSESFLLSVGHLEPRKNYKRLVSAFSLLPIDIQKQYKLIIVGKKNHDYTDIIKEIDNNENVYYLDFIKREDLIWLYANCKLHIFPSFYEGFGFPSLEAGIFGKPTIGANQSSIEEVSGKGGIYFDPFDILDIKSKVNQVLSSEKVYSKLSKEAFKNTKLYSWSKNASETLELYKKVNNN